MLRLSQPSCQSRAKRETQQRTADAENLGQQEVHRMTIREFFAGLTRADWLQLIGSVLGTLGTLAGAWLGFVLSNRATQRAQRRTTRKLALSAIDRAMQAGNAGASCGLNGDAIDDHISSLGWRQRRRVQIALRAYRAAHGSQHQDSCGQAVYQNPSLVADALNRLRDACQ